MTALALAKKLLFTIQKKLSR